MGNACFHSVEVVATEDIKTYVVPLILDEIKSKIVNKIKLNALDISHIKKLEDNDKFDLIKLFNHMV
jgi:hypothetical protein